VENVVWYLTKHLQASGYEVDVVSLNRLFDQSKIHLPCQEKVDGIKIRRLPYWGSRRYAIAPKVLSLVKSYDILHIHSGDFFLDYLALTKFIHKKSLVLHTHGMFFHTPFARKLKEFYFHIITRLDITQIAAVICDSTHDYEMLRQVTPEQKLFMIPNGIAYDKLSVFGSEQRDPNLLITVGRLADNKRVDRLLRAFALVIKQRPMAKLVIIGPDWGELASLKTLTNTLKLNDHVNFQGEVSEAELLHYLSRASLWLTASIYESFGIALVEAMASGCVCVVQPLAPFRQLLEESTEGFYTDFEQPEQAAVHILKALALSQSERQRIITAARTKAAQFSWDTITQSIQQIYAQVISI